ncbi:MAG: translation initiation factor IF-2 [Chloroflexi bacterium]|nr:translation initiation factor IF-2 [Chloroflexota bacterium]
MTQAESPVRIPDAITVKDLADLLSVTPIDVIKELMKNGVMATINQVVDFDTAAIVASDFGFAPEEANAAPALVATAPTAPEEAGEEAGEGGRATTSRRIIEEDGPDLRPRPPIITVLGHVDHGKTTLLDRIREEQVAASEAGGITQHIGAYRTTAPDGRPITFIDTPGHEAFTQMRARGAQVTDVAIVVVAADDGVMPQTREAIDHVRAAGVPLVVAINKIDTGNANPDRVKQQLMEVGLVPEEFGGEQVVVPISAQTGEGIATLVENVQLVADLQELAASPERAATGIVLEAATDPHRGVVATVLVQTGTLHVGDAILAGYAHGRVKAMTDERGERLREAGPSVPAAVLGLSEVPPAGERTVVVASDRAARRLAEERRRAAEAGGESAGAVSLDTLFGEIHSGNVRDFNVVLKTDVQGSVEPLVRSLEELAVDEVNVKVIHAAAGSINESDVNLAVASQGVILGFNTRPELGARRLATQEGVEIRLYDVIYQMLDDVRLAVSGLLEPIFEERQDAVVEVRAVFRRGRRNAIAGCYVRDGAVRRGSKARVLRRGEQLHEGEIDSLRRVDDDAREVTAGFECGIMIGGFTDFEEGDEIVTYHLEQTR